LLVGTTNVMSEFNNINTSLSRVSYNSGTDTAAIDNNVTISQGKNLLVGTTNVMSEFSNINTSLSGVSYNSGTDTTTIDNIVVIPSGKHLFLVE
jgi:hypothetical protein